MASEVRNTFDLNTFLNYTIRIYSWPICLSTPALDGRLHLVSLVLWLCSFQPWCIVESITFYLLLRIDRHCQTVFPVNAWNTGNVVALSLPSALQICQTSFIPGGVFVELVIDNNSKNWDICFYGKTVLHDIVMVRLLLSSSSMCPVPRCAGSIWLLLVLPVADVMRLHYFQVRVISLVWQHSQMLGKYTSTHLDGG